MGTLKKYQRKPTTVYTEQFMGPGVPAPHGVLWEVNEEGQWKTWKAYVVTIHGQRAYLLPGDWIMPEPDGEHFYPCNPDVFSETYELIEE